MSLLGIPATIARLSNAMELAQAIFESDLARGVIPRPEPRAEWLGWTDGSTA